MLSDRSKDLEAVKIDAKRLWGRIPGVIGFGIGQDCLRVYVHNSKVQKKFPEKKFPETFEGVKLDIIITGDIVAA